MRGVVVLLAFIGCVVPGDNIPDGADDRAEESLAVHTTGPPSNSRLVDEELPSIDDFLPETSRSPATATTTADATPDTLLPSPLPTNAAAAHTHCPVQEDSPCSFFDIYCYNFYRDDIVMFWARLLLILLIVVVARVVIRCASSKHSHPTAQKNEDADVVTTDALERGDTDAEKETQDRPRAFSMSIRRTRAASTWQESHHTHALVVHSQYMTYGDENERGIDEMRRRRGLSAIHVDASMQAAERGLRALLDGGGARVRYGRLTPQREANRSADEL